MVVLIKKELSLTYTMSGALMSSYFVGYALGQIPWGILADKFGSRKVVFASILGIALSTILFGFSYNVLVAVFSRFLSGLLGAGVFVPGVRLISGWFPPELRGTALGILSIGGSIGLIISSWITPSITLQIGWRGTMKLFGFLGIISTILIFITIRDHSIRTSIEKRNNEIYEIFKSSSFWILGIVQICRLGSNYAFIAWLPLILREEFRFSLVAAGGAFSLFNIAGMISNPIGGFISDRLGEKTVLFSSFFFLGIATLVFSGIKISSFLYLTIIALGWFINFLRSPSFAVLPKLYGVNNIGKISGFQNTFASLGALILPFILGYIKDTTASYSIGLNILSVFFFITAFLNIFIKIPRQACGLQTSLNS